MFDSEFISKLKQTNISADGEKTKERAEAVWKSSSKSDKDKICALADVTRTTVYRSYNTGSISAKLVAAFSQVLKINPGYLTGEADEKLPYSSKILEDFLVSKKYQKQISAYKSRLAPKEDEIDDISDSFGSSDDIDFDLDFDSDFDDIDPELLDIELDSSGLKANEFFNVSLLKIPNPKVYEYMKQLSEEELVILLKAAIIRSKAFGDSERLADLIKLALLS